MLNESDDGKCPYCGYEHMLMRYGSDGYWQFDACPKCGHSAEEGYKQTLDSNGNFEHFVDIDRKDFWTNPVYYYTREEWLKQFENESTPINRARESVFCYHKKDGKVETCNCEKCEYKL